MKTISGPLNLIGDGRYLLHLNSWKYLRPVGLLNFLGAFPSDAGKVEGVAV